MTRHDCADQRVPRDSFRSMNPWSNGCRMARNVAARFANARRTIC